MAEASSASSASRLNRTRTVPAKFDPGDFSGTTTGGTVRKARTASPGKSGPKRKLGDADMAKKIKFIGDASNKDYITCRAHNANGKTVKEALKLKFKDREGKQQPYRTQDIEYDLARNLLSFDGTGSSKATKKRKAPPSDETDEADADAGPSVAKLNEITTKNTSALDEITMPDAVKEKLVKLEFDDWDDVAAETGCDDDVLSALKELTSTWKSTPVRPRPKKGANKEKTAELPKEKLVLYANEACPFAHRAHIAALEKGAPFEYFRINTNYADIYFDATLSKDEHFMKNVNPQGTVPALEYGSTPINESDVCAEFLDAMYGVPYTLMPADPLKAARVRKACKVVDPGCLYKLLSNQDPSQDEALAAAVDSYTAKVEGLIEGPFFFGQEVSLADVLLVPFLDRFRYLLKHYRGYDLLTAGSKLAGLLHNFEQRPSFKETALTEEKYISLYPYYANGATGAKTGRGQSTDAERAALSRNDSLPILAVEGLTVGLPP